MGETPRPVDMNESHGMSAVTMRLNSPTNDKPACNLNWRQGEDLGSGMRLISSGIRLVGASSVAQPYCQADAECYVGASLSQDEFIRVVDALIVRR